MDEIQNTAEAQPAWQQLAAGAGSWGLPELGNNGENSCPLSSLPVDRLTATDYNATARTKIYLFRAMYWFDIDP